MDRVKRITRPYLRHPQEHSFKLGQWNQRLRDYGHSLANRQATSNKHRHVTITLPTPDHPAIKALLDE